MLMKRPIYQLSMCAALLAGQNLWAEDDAKGSKKKEVVIVQKRSSDTLENIKGALDKTEIAEEVKADVLKKLETALQSLDKSSKNAKPGEKNSVRLEISGSKSDPNDQQEVRVTIVDGDDEDKQNLRLRGLGNLQGLTGGKLQTQVLRPFSMKDSFRIGVVCQQANDDEGSEGSKSAEHGLRIDSVIDDSPAAQAGIQKGDVLVTVNGKPIGAIKDLTDAIQEAGKNEKDVNLEIARGDQKKNYQVKPRKMKTSDLEMDNVNLLNLPSEGFVVDEESMKKWQDFAKQWKGSGPQSFAFALPGNDELKKEIDQLKAEIAELKNMIRELSNKK